MKIGRRAALKVSLSLGGGLGVELLTELTHLSRFPRFARQVFAQQSADYSDMINWFSANSGAGSYYDSCNRAMVSPFNNIYSGTYSPDDINSIANQGNQMANYSYSTGNPTLDTCTQACVMTNVPSPGNASQVLFANPDSDQLNRLHSTTQGYGYNASYGDLAQWAYVPNVSTWNSSNYIYPLTSSTASISIGKVVSGLDEAATAYRDSQRHGGGQWSLSQDQCAKLVAGIQVVGGLAIIGLGVSAFALLTGNLPVAAAVGSATAALAIVLGAAIAIHAIACPL